MRILGIDYGTKRIGIAMSDEAGQFAIPHSTIQNVPNSTSNVILKRRAIIGEIVSIANKNTVSIIVIGESRDYKGEPNKIFADVLELKKELESLSFTVHLEPEFMTSQQAERFQGKNDLTDASAAALILQAYLDKNKAIKE